MVDKEVGLTSHDVVSRVRRIFGNRQVGHAGTLDPVASGVLVILVGSATRIAQYLQEDDKEYHLSMVLGVSTDTQDMTGKVTSNAESVDVTREAFEGALERYRGSFLQVPPSYSAVKRNGQPLYRLARKGIAVQADPRRVTIYSIEVDQFAPPKASLRVVCSKGTYMRTLCHDVGRDLGVGGCMESLVRMRSGAFSLRGAVQLDEMRQCADPRLRLRDAASGLPFRTVDLPDGDLARFMRGGEAVVNGGEAPGLVSVTRGKWLLAIGEAALRDGNMTLAPRKILEPEWKELFKIGDK